MSDLDDAINASRGKTAPGGGTPANTGSTSATSGGTSAPAPAPASQTPLQRQIAADPYPTLPPNPGVGDYLHTITSQLGRGVANVGRVGADALTRGWYDREQADPEAARAKTEQASEELGTGGNLGIRTMASIPGRIFKGASLLKSGIEGGVSGAVDAYGHGGSAGDVVLGGLTGFGTGTGVTAATQAAAAGARKLIASSPTAKALVTATKNWIAPNTKTQSSVTQTAKDEADRQFQQLDQNQYNPAHVGNVADQTHDQVFQNDPVRINASPGTHGVLSDFKRDIWQKAGQGQPATAGDIHTQIKALGDVAKRGGQDGADAMKARDFLIQSYGNLPPLNNTAPNVMAQFQKANAAHAVQKNAEMLEGMNENLGLYGDMPGPTAKTALEKQPGFYKGPGQQQAMQDIATSGAKPAGWSPWITGGFGVGGAVFGHPGVGTAVGGGLEAARHFATPAAARRAVYDAYPALTGQELRNPEDMASQAMTRAGIGALSTVGGGKPNPQDMIPGYAKPWIDPYIFGQ